LFYFYWCSIKAGDTPAAIVSIPTSGIVLFLPNGRPMVDRPTPVSIPTSGIVLFLLAVLRPTALSQSYGACFHPDERDCSISTHRRRPLVEKPRPTGFHPDERDCSISTMGIANGSPVFPAKFPSRRAGLFYFYSFGWGKTFQEFGTFPSRRAGLFYFYPLALATMDETR